MIIHVHHLIIEGVVLSEEDLCGYYVPLLYC